MANENENGASNQGANDNDSGSDENMGAEGGDKGSNKKQFTDEEKLNHHLGIVNRLKTKLGVKEESEGKTENKSGKKESPDDLAQKAYLRSAQIVEPDEVELALSTAAKWGISIDKLVDDEDFKVKLEKIRTQKANELATSNIKGGKSGTSQAKLTAEYWIAKNQAPTAADVPDRKTRVKIVRAMMASTKSSKKFYND